MSTEGWILIISLLNSVAIIVLAAWLYLHTGDLHGHPDEETEEPESEQYGHPNGSRRLSLGQWVREGR